MYIESEPITGREASADGYMDEAQDPRRCLIAFYRAFNQRDLTAVERNWSCSEAASMSNPLGGVKRGWPAIREVYARIFLGPVHVYVEFYDYSLHVGTDLFCAVGRERGHCTVNNERIELAIRTTRLYRREASGWRQLHHHGSIDDAELLARYQALVIPSTTVMTK